METKGNASATQQSLGVSWVPKEAKDRERIVVEHLPLVYRLCRRFMHSGEPLDDLIQVGTIGLVKAIDKFDPDRGSSFTALAIPMIVGEIKNYFRDHGWAVRIPRKLQRNKRLVDGAVDRLSQSFGRSPAITEIAEATGLSEPEVYDTLEVGRPLSLDAQYDGNGNNDASSLLDHMGSEDPQFEELIDRIAVTNSLGCLTPRERETSSS